MLGVNPYLNFNGDCKLAMQFYAKLFGGKLEMQTFGESPMAGQAGNMKDKVLHARLQVGDTVIMASDAPSDRYEKPQGTWVSLNVDTAADADRIFNALADGGSVEMQIQETFWAERFGTCVDRFGTPWMVNCSKAMVTA
jgi:PhnB protein